MAANKARCKSGASGLNYLIRSYLVDSGATDTFVKKACERFLRNVKPSSAIIHIADNSVLHASVTGDMDIFAINTPGYKGLGLGCKFTTKATVVPDIATELLSLSELFAEQGFKVTLDPNGVSELYLFDDDTGVETRIPIRYDYDEKGFFIDGIMGGTAAQQELLAARIADKTARSTKRHNVAMAASTFDRKHLPTVTQMLRDHDDVEYLQCSEHAETDIIAASHEPVPTCSQDSGKKNIVVPEYSFCAARKVNATKDPLIIRRDLTGKNRGLNFKEAHDLFIHKGHHPDCWICKMVNGAIRREKTSDPDLRVQSNRPGHTFALDICQWSHRATSGEGYTAQMIDICTGTPFGHHLVFKNDFVDVLEEWIIQHRKDPLYNWMDYPFCSELYLDRDGIWDENCVKWNQVIRKGLNVTHHYSSPDKKNTNARPENAIKELERATKSLLFSKNLPPQEWLACADQANWLNARLAYNQRSRDGDDPLPLELLTNGQISRRQIQQQLSAFVPVGTPCLVWNPAVKGSAIQSKVRWGIAQRMTGKSVEFLCPYNSHTFISGSFMAVKLKDGLNFYQFLGIKCPELSNASLIPALPDSPMFITLPELAQCVTNLGPPSTKVEHHSVDPKPFVHILDPAGRVFKADPNGTFEHTGRSIHDNADESDGFLSDLNKKGIVQDGWNDTPTHNRDYNYQVMVLANRPRDFIGRCFEKGFTRSATGIIELHSGRVYSYNQKDVLWRVQYGDGQTEDFDAKDIIHYVIEQKTTDINNDQVGTTGNTDASCEIGSSSSEPNPGEKLLAENSGCNSTPENVFSKDDGSTVENDDQEVFKPKSPDHGETFSCIFKCKRFQVIPKYNHLGEEPPSRDFWNDVVRRVTYNYHNNEIIEDLTIEQIGIHGATEKLPCNVKEIRAVFFFKRDCTPHSERLGRRCYVSQKGDKFKDILNHVGIRPEHLRSYLKYMNLNISNATLGTKTPRKLVKAFCKVGILFEAPAGERWVNLVNAYHAKVNKENPIWKTTRLIERACEEEEAMIRTCIKLDISRHMGHEFMARKAYALCAVQNAAKRHVTFQHLTAADKLIKISKAMNSIAKPSQPDDLLKDPSNIFDALSRDNAQDWIRALLDEEASLDALGVFLHDQSASQLKALGITAKYIIPSRYVIAVKRHPDRTIDKLKVRRVIQGHKWAMQRGVHYDESFTASPTQDTTRLLQALSIGNGWIPYCFDVKCAYQNAPATGPKLAIKYPKGFERRNAKGEELYAVLQANLQGKADAGRQWGQYRDEWIMDTFNKDKWTCKQSIRDPCLFTITCPEGDTTHMVCYTDDCDCHTTSMASVLKIAAKFENRFGIKVVNPEFMLGVKRKRYHREGVLYVHLSQEEYIAELYESFKPLMSEKRRPQNLPFPKGKRLYVGCDEPEEGEITQNIEKGYMRLCGALLWAARNTMPSISFAISQLCKMMSSPTDECFELALQTLQYAYDNRHLGIVFRSDGNALPVTYYDASFNPDPNDGKSQYGFSTHLYGGPVSWISKKLKHVGTHVGQNETMSQTWAGKNSAWVYFLMEEINHKPAQPVDLFGDNDQTNRLGQENMMTTCNRYYWPQYYWVKEAHGHIINCERVPTADNCSDILTKAVDKPTLDHLLPRLSGHSGVEGNLPLFDLKNFSYKLL